jgi:hypothetical protein
MSRQIAIAEHDDPVVSEGEGTAEITLVGKVRDWAQMDRRGTFVSTITWISRVLLESNTFTFVARQRFDTCGDVTPRCRSSETKQD